MSQLVTVITTVIITTHLVWLYFTMQLCKRFAI